jgi:hypothetical protein
LKKLAEKRARAAGDVERYAKASEPDVLETD